MKNLLLLLSLLFLPKLSFAVDASDLLDNWNLVSSGTLANLRGVSYGKSIFVSIGDTNHAVISANGTNWQKCETGVGGLRDIAFGADKFVAVGFAGVVITSSNGIVWTQQSFATNHDLLCVTYGNGLFVAGGTDGDIFTSPDCLAWTQRTSSLTNGPLPILVGPIRDIACLNGRFIATRLGSNVVSADGMSWSLSENNPSGLTYFGVAASGFPNWAKVGANGSIYYSTDGTNWQNSLTFPLPHVTQTLRRVNLCGNIYIAVGDAGTIVTSQYYSASRSIVSGTVQNLNDVISGDGRVVIVGNGGTILTVQTRPLITNFQRLLDGSTRMTSRGVYYQPYYLKASTNFTVWEVVGTSSPEENGDLSFLDDWYAPGLSQIFYRLDTTP